MSYAQACIELVGICGLARAGKDTLANRIVERVPGTVRMALADPLKRDVVALGLATEEQVCEKDPRTRRILQVWGTEHGRAVDDQYWLLRFCAGAFQMCARAGGNPPMPERFVVPDIRYPNEADFILRNRGILFWVDAAERLDKPMNHASELSLPKIVRAKAQHTRFVRLSNNADEATFLETCDEAIDLWWLDELRNA